MSDPLATVVAKLRSADCDPRETGPESWEARCPSHKGDRRNLSLTRGNDGRVLLHCFHEPTCNKELIVGSLGLRMADLFPADAGRPKATTNGKPARKAWPRPEDAVRGLGTPSARWDYTGDDGSVAFVVFRFDGAHGKTFRPVHKTAEGWVSGDPPDPLPLYRLHLLDDASRVYVCEGEKAADFVACLGLTATTSAHGAQSPAKTDWKRLAGRDVVILPDHDGPGEGYAAKVKALLAALSPRPVVRVVRLVDLWRSNEPIPDGGDVEEWLRDGIPREWGDEHCRDELERVADSTGPEVLEAAPRPTEGASPPTAELTWPESPRPIRYDMRPVPPMQPSMIPEPLRDWLADIAARISCPLDFPVVGAIIALSIVLGRKVGIRPKRRDDWCVVANLWGAIVGRPGAMKTPAIGEAMKPLSRLEFEARERHAEEQNRFMTASLLASVKADAAKNQLKLAARDGKPQAVLDSLANEIANTAPPEPPKLRRYTTTDSTVEKLGELLRDNPNGLGTVRDELTGWLNSFDKPGRESDRAFYLEAWNGNGPAFVVDRIGRGTTYIEHPCVSVLGGIQPGPLRSLLRRVTSGKDADDGLVSRLQLLVWPDSPATWHNVDRWPDTHAKNRAHEVFKALDTLDPAAVGATTDEDDDLPYFRFTDEAQGLFDAWRSDLENNKLRSAEESPLIESHLAKYRSLLPSLALLFHVVEIVDGREEPGPVGPRPARMAIDWCHYLEAHARRFYASVADRDLEPALALSRKIKEGVLPSPFAYRDVYRKCWSNLDDPDSVRRAAMALEELGWVQVLEVVDTGGRPREEVHIHPALPRKEAS